ncbi:restriction endonuclease subunit S [Malaciobacter halophilus]|nr:restriction endonuclease subunit S [Malaciobacter halophilus]
MMRIIMSKNRRMPQLRFKEFSGEWENKCFGDIYSFLQTNSFSRALLNYENGDIKNIHYGDIHTKFKSNFYIQDETVPYINQNIDLSKIKEENYCKEKDLVIADASEDYKDIGKAIELIDLNNEKLLTGLHTYIARDYKNKMALGFSGYFMQTYKVRVQMMKMATGISVLGISKGNLNKLELTIPQKQEQEKIASFLSSIDKKINQLSKKDELLQNYKKAMMQKIFSQKLRFKKENRSDYPKWEEKSLNELVEFNNGKAHENNIDESGKYIVVNSKFISSNGTVKKYSNSQIFPLHKNDIVMVMSDVPNGKALSKCYLIDKDNKYTLNQRICSLRQTVNNNRFLIYLINRNKYYLAFDSGVGQTNLRRDEVLNLKLKVPSIEEQTKIANFLFSLDTKISQNKKALEVTKKFKKALLQKMFV